MRFDKEKSQLNYDIWNSSGRMSIGENTEIMVNDRRLFPQAEEVEITFEIHDGFAVGNYQGKEYLMLYPMMGDVRNNPKWLEQIEDYVGFDMVDETGLQLQDVALTFGRIVSSRQLPLNLDSNDTVIRLDAKVPVEKALGIINDEIRRTIRNDYHLDIPEVTELPERQNGNVEKGYLILSPEKPAQFISQPKTIEELEELEKEAISTATLESLKQVIEAMELRKQQNLTDIQFIKGEGRIYSVTCKIEGVQMPLKELGVRESQRVHQNIIRGMDPLLTFNHLMVLKKFSNELQQVQPAVVEQGPAVKDYKDFRKALHEKYPDGLTLQIFGMDYYSMMGLTRLSTELSDCVDENDVPYLTMPKWDGKIVEGEPHPGKDGKPSLYTTVHITPEQYRFLYPEIHFSMGETTEDLLDLAAERQFNMTGGYWSEMSFQIPQCLDFRQTMQIENVPYRQAFQIRVNHGCIENKEIAECIALIRYMELGVKTDIQPTELNRGIVGNMEKLISRMEDRNPQYYDDAVRKEASIQMREKGFYPHERYNITFNVKATDRMPEENAVRITEELNRNFPYVSALCEVDKVHVSVNTAIPMQQAAVERFIINQQSLASRLRIKPFMDLKDTNRLIYMMSNGQTIDAYFKRPGAGKNNLYAVEKMDGILFMRNLKPGEDASSPHVIATDDKLNAKKVQVFDCYKQSEDYFRVRDSSLYRKQRPAGLAPEWMVRCKVDGVQEMGRSVSMNLNHIINCVTGNGTKVPDSRTWNMLKHYAALVQFRDMLQTNGQEQMNGLKR